MPTPKGYVTSQKEDRTSAEHVTITPVGQFKYGLDVSNKGVFQVGTDAVEANSTTSVIVATAHAALIGDTIRFTSGTHSGIEVNVIDTDTNNLTLGQTLSSAPSALDSFSILRPITQTMTATGATTMAMSFTRDGSNQDVIEDTGTPANNRPLPVKLMDTGGNINIDVANQNISVQLDHDSANPDSVQIGDGTEIMAINASNEAQVRDDDANTTLTTIAGDTTSLDGKVTACDTGNVTIGAAIPAGANIIGKTYLTDGTEDAAVNASNELQVRDDDANTALSTIAGDTTSLDGKVTACDTSDVTLNPASETKITDGTETANVNASNELQVSDDSARTSLSTIAGDTTSLDGKITACNTGNVTIGAALPSGTNNIGDVDIASSLPAGTNTIGKAYITDGTEDAAVNASNELQVADDTARSSLSTIEGDTTSIDGKITACDTGNVTIGAALPAGANNIGDVDIASALPAGTNTIGKAYITDGTDDALVSDSGELQVVDDGANSSLSTIAGAVDGTEMQVDIVSSIPAGTNEIGFVKVRHFRTLENSFTDVSSSNIPGSASSPLELVASLSNNIIAFQVFDTSGGVLELMTGAVASEVRLCLVGPGNDSIIYAQANSSTRISVRRVDSTSALTSGTLSINYIGYS